MSVLAIILTCVGLYQAQPFPTSRSLVGCHSNLYPHDHPRLESMATIRSLAPSTPAKVLPLTPGIQTIPSTSLDTLLWPLVRHLKERTTSTGP